MDTIDFNTNPTFIPVYNFIHGEAETEQYWLHPDHLGSATYLSDENGKPYQFRYTYK